jgi:hypothetical protein
LLMSPSPLLPSATGITLKNERLSPINLAES